MLASHLPKEHLCQWWHNYLFLTAKMNSEFLVYLSCIHITCMYVCTDLIFLTFPGILNWQCEECQQSTRWWLQKPVLLSKPNLIFKIHWKYFPCWEYSPDVWSTSEWSFLSLNSDTVNDLPRSLLSKHLWTCILWTDSNSGKGYSVNKWIVHVC